MIKNRSFMIGLGSGLVAGALLLQLMNAAGLSAPSRGQLIREAAERNLRIVDADERLLTEDEWRAMASPSPAGSPAPSVQPSPSSSPAPKAKPTSKPAAGKKPAASSAGTAGGAAGAAAPAVKPAEPGKPASPSSSPLVKPAAPKAPSPASASAKEPIVLRIPNGATLSEVADILAASEVITDKDQFLVAAHSSGIQRKIQYGLYSFKPGESLDSIIVKLITVKD
ncbi:hypothetical protein [Paenibacillus glufosinatiresistens]|uniref:hypothetical protein n=1 Tax=Paenibacillus glufosinatiresistens TaxID=3070657 RepID=UPI00286E0A65|nr:hypothetical protein [Paenibacillus sp. YX.27]